MMQEAERVGYVYIKIDITNAWQYRANPLFDDKLKFYNFPAEPKRVLIPWTKDTVPREAWIRWKLDTAIDFRILSIGVKHFKIGHTIYKYTAALEEFEHSLDNGHTWLPCGTWKEEV